MDLIAFASIGFVFWIPSFFLLRWAPFLKNFLPAFIICAIIVSMVVVDGSSGGFYMGFLAICAISFFWSLILFIYSLSQRKHAKNIEDSTPSNSGSIQKFLLPLIVVLLLCMAFFAFFS
ncbi:MAG: hypothetical protein GY810_28730 [Aureispira sp.]|nr:hypothetical protein [Aureispira sp.]